MRDVGCSPPCTYVQPAAAVPAPERAARPAPPAFAAEQRRAFQRVHPLHVNSKEVDAPHAPLLCVYSCQRGAWSASPAGTAGQTEQVTRSPAQSCLSHTHTHSHSSISRTHMPSTVCSCHRSYDQQGALRATHVVLLHHTEMDVMAPSVASLATLIASVRTKLAAWRGAAAAAEDLTDYIAAVDLHVMSVLVSSSLSSLQPSLAAGKGSRPGDDAVVPAVNGTPPPPPKVQMLVQVRETRMPGVSNRGFGSS